LTKPLFEDRDFFKQPFAFKFALTKINYSRNSVSTHVKFSQCHKTATPNINTSMPYITCVLLQNISTSLLQYLLAKYVLWALANFSLQKREQIEFIILNRGLSFSWYTVLPLAITRISDARRWGRVGIGSP